MNTNKRIFVICLTTFLMILMFASTVFIPTTTAHNPPQQVHTTAYLVLAPDHVGVGQKVFVDYWLDWIPLGAGGITGGRWTNLKIYITAPDGTQQTLGPYTSDPIGTGYASFTPTQVGTYTFNFSFPGQIGSNINPDNGMVGSTTNAIFINDTFLASSTVKTLTVQEQPLLSPPSYPLPSEYWSHPIDGQNTDWFTIASNWLGGGMLVHKNVQTHGIAPNTPHIMWTKSIQDGGLAGGSYNSNYEVEGVTYYTGDSYEVRFQESIVINGRLYYTLPLNHQGGNGGYECVDLQTGQLLWNSDKIGVIGSPSPTFGQLYDYESMNQHGAIGGILWQVSGTTWTAYDSRSGTWLYNLTDVPTGYGEYGPNGEILRYVINYNSAKNTGWLGLWNNTCEHQGLQLGTGDDTNAYQWRPANKVVNMSKAYSWNVTIPALAGLGAPTIRYVIADDLVLGSSTTFNNYATGTPDPYTMWAISLKPESRGNLLWIKNYSAPTTNTTIHVQTALADSQSRIWLTYNVNTLEWTGYSMDSGNQVWGPLRVPGNDWDFHSRANGGYPSHAGIGEARTIAYGKLYLAGYSGIINSVDMATGRVEWTYGNGEEGNSTDQGLGGPWGHYPTFISKIADEKIYTFTSEHSTGQPIYKGATWRCINATNGQEIWKISGYSERNMGVIADGYFVNFNEYDGQVYCIGKGPSAIKVDAPMTAAQLGTSIVVRGTITDIAAGTQQTELTARFPNGVPAMSDNSMTAWMEYVYMQKPRPTNATGVPITIDVIDSNGNFRNIGHVTSDDTGMFTLTWKPDVPGSYKVIANFAGSQSYWPSNTETSFAVDEATPTPTQQPILAQAPTETYIMAGVLAIIIAVAIGFAITILTLRRRP